MEMNAEKKHYEASALRLASRSLLVSLFCIIQFLGKHSLNGKICPDCLRAKKYSFHFTCIDSAGLSLVKVQGFDIRLGSFSFAI